MFSGAFLTDMRDWMNCIVANVLGSRSLVLFASVRSSILQKHELTY